MPYKNIEDRRNASKRSYQKHKEKILVKQKDKRNENIEEFREQRKEYYKKNKERMNEHASNHYFKNKEYCQEKQREWKEANKEKHKAYEKEYERNRYETDPQYRLRKNCRSRVYNALRGIAIKSDKTVNLIGCPIPELKTHLESQFTEGMSWENYGDWHVDHIKPCASFDLTDPDQQKECFNFSNLQPLWAYDNMSKGAKL
tara:strand:- start:825 stop:1427 length:603 start_codon:yes stop_codon:yes gene_type:complete